MALIKQMEPFEHPGGLSHLCHNCLQQTFSGNESVPGSPDGQRLMFLAVSEPKVISQ
jgi:hypothetical protein